MVVKVLVLNTFLLRTVPGPQWFAGPLGTAPAIDARAAELAAVVADYDVAALCEVFDPAEAEVLASARPEFTASATPGPAADTNQRVSGGLLTLSALPLARTATHRYLARGSRLHDPDAWAAKGVSMVEVATPQGPNLEIYNTHLIAGDDLVPRRVLGRPGEAVHQVRRDQVDELAAFVERTTNPANAALVCGDLNTDARSPDGQRMLATFGDAGFIDLWSESTQGKGSTADLPARPQCYPPDLHDARFFADGPTPTPNTETPARIDYALLRNAPGTTSDAHVRRRRLPRPSHAPGVRHFAWMSDHVGLHLELA